MITRYFRRGALRLAEEQAIQHRAAELGFPLRTVESEWCFYVGHQRVLSRPQRAQLEWLLGETFDRGGFGRVSHLSRAIPRIPGAVVEIGPRLAFETPWSTTAVSICHRCGIGSVRRLERARRIHLVPEQPSQAQDVVNALLPSLYDRMTEQVYLEPLTSFGGGRRPHRLQIIPLIERGPEVLRELNVNDGLGLTDADIEYLVWLFVAQLWRNPTNVELFQYAQANSSHSRHWEFKGQIVVGGEVQPYTLMDLVQHPWRVNPGNTLVAFADDSSVMGVPWKTLVLEPQEVAGTAEYRLVWRERHPTDTAETHNHPTGIAAYPGSGTGGGGRIRDNGAVGQGGLTAASATIFMVGNLQQSDYPLPWEQYSLPHPANLMAPLDILTDAVRGAFDYGNCYGEPVIQGSTRTVGLYVGGEYCSYFKPLMYSDGMGLIDRQHLQKDDPRKGYLVVKIGPPSYHIGIGGGAASSMISGVNTAELDFQSVQRADPVSGRTTTNVIRACIRLGKKSPIAAVRDHGAGGSSNALPELVDPAGGVIHLMQIPVGDQTLDEQETWGNESQEQYGLLVYPRRLPLLQAICDRENVLLAVVGVVTGDGRIKLVDDRYPNQQPPVDLPLDLMLGKLPQRQYETEPWVTKANPLELPPDLTVEGALERVLRLMSVGSKGSIVNTVDHTVGGLTASHQCVGPYGTPVGDFATLASGHFGVTGTVHSLGEQPLKGLISPEACARLTVSEMVLNLIGAGFTSLADVNLQANWMLAAKLGCNLDWIYRAAKALDEILVELRERINGGKDSLSMAAITKNTDGESVTVMAPSTLVLHSAVPTFDIRVKATPDLTDDSDLLFIDLSPGKCRLGGSALAQVFEQVGDDCPDLEDVGLLATTVEQVQALLKDGLITAVHDRSDGGLITTVLEMAFAGGVGLNLSLVGENALATFFNEEPGMVIGCRSAETTLVLDTLLAAGLTVTPIGSASQDNLICIDFNGESVVTLPQSTLHQLWWETSFAFDRQQTNQACVDAEQSRTGDWAKPPRYQMTFAPSKTRLKRRLSARAPKVAVIRAPGTNGEVEMAAAFRYVGFRPHDVTLYDLLQKGASLDEFRGVIWPGGFADGDIMDSGKGVAGTVRANRRLAALFGKFLKRDDVFSLGICNGCQIGTLLGWVPFPGLADEYQPRFIKNRSERFESRYPTVKIEASPAIMLQGMAGSVLPLIAAHGEGRAHFPRASDLQRVLQLGLAPVRYTYPWGQLAGQHHYPHNPNGSPHGIAALCDETGRHFYCMLHLERLFQLWQYQWTPSEWSKLPTAPWVRAFDNLYNWCQR